MTFRSPAQPNSGGPLAVPVPASEPLISDALSCSLYGALMLIRN